MLHALKRIYLWWIRYGEGPSLSRTATILGAVATFAAAYWHSASDVAGEISLVLAWFFGSITALVVIRWILIRGFWPWRKRHPGVLGASEFLVYVPPEPEKDSPYRFCLVDSLHELKPYIDESEYFLGEANPDLDRDRRRQLYENWFSLSPWAFMYLMRTDLRIPVALSIILPLTKKGYESLYGTQRPHKKVIDFGREEIAKRGPYEYLLVDTFIICKRSERKAGNSPTGQRRYGRTLILRHLAHFWKDQQDSKGSSQRLLGLPDPGPIVVVAETDKESLVKDLLEIGFAVRGKSAIGCPLYELRYPLTPANANQEELAKRLIEKIWEVRRWKIRVNRWHD